MKTLNNFTLKQKNILFRADLNVPVVNGIITEKSRIHIIKSSIKKLQKQKNKIFIISHYGRPKGKINKKYSLNFICPTLKKELGVNKIFFLESLESKKIKKIIMIMKPGDICLFENIRFYPQEENNQNIFARRLAENFDAYVNDAFSASHRSHASIVGIPKFLPSVAGLGLLEEINNINLFLKNSKKPNLAIIGGSKISSKIDILYNLVELCDFIAIGGAMANTFLYAKGMDIGNSLCEKELSTTAISIIKKSKEFKCEIILPVDVVCADHLNDKKNIRECDIKDIYTNQMILDIGSKTTKLISSYILKSKMLLWNGPLGAFEYEFFEKSSVEIATIIKNNYLKLNISTLAGGGDTISVINLAKAESGFSYISKAGGAFLEWLEGRESPGVLALKENSIN